MADALHDHVIENDEEDLARMGYKQELKCVFIIYPYIFATLT